MESRETEASLLSYEANPPGWKKFLYFVVVAQIPCVLQITVRDNIWVTVM
jgi:hypothetical protein